MKRKILALACAVSLFFATPVAAAEYQPVTVTLGSTETLPPPVPRGHAWFSATSLPAWVHLSEADGSIRLSPSADVTPGVYEWPIVAHLPDETTEIYSVRVAVVAPGTDEGAVADLLGKVGIEEVTPKCATTALSVGLPLLALIPLGFATQLGLPVVAVKDSINLEITNLPRPVKIHLKPRVYNERNADLGIAAILTVAGIAGAAVIYSQCAQASDASGTGPASASSHQDTDQPKSSADRPSQPVAVPPATEGGTILLPRESPASP